MMEDTKVVLIVAGSLVVGVVVILAAIVGGAVLLDRSELCRDALLRPEAWSGLPAVECPRADQTLVRDGDHFRCVCPNTSRPAP